jgi:hypothetical protein
MTTTNKLTIIIDHERYGARTEFVSIEEAVETIRSIGPDFASVTLDLQGDIVIDHRGEAVGSAAATAPHGWLLRYSDASYIRPATARELRDSICAGAEGVIEVVIDGERVACYVEE